MKYKANKDGRTPLHMAGFCNSDEDILNALITPEDILELPKRKGLISKMNVQNNKLQQMLQ